MQQVTALPRWGLWAAGSALLLVALAAGALSLAVNITYGLGAGLALAVAYGLSDIAKLTLPVVAAGIGWSRYTWLVAVAAAVVSVWCAANYFADTEGQRLMTASHQAGQIETAKADAARWRDELDTLEQAGDADILQERADTLEQAIADEAADIRCGPECRKLQRERDGVLDDLSKAERKAELEARLDAARTRLNGEPPAETSGIAAVLASATGTDKQQAARYVVTARALAALVLIEMLAHLAGAAARMIGAAMRSAPKPEMPAEAEPEPEHTAEVIPLTPHGRARHGFASLAGVAL